MDGVPYVSQPLVETGETFVYRFPINETGTYWYHAHNKAWEHVARGLYGPLIITNNLNNSLGRRDILVVADDWLINENNQVDEESFGNLMHWSHAGRYGNRLSINGQFSPKIEIHRFVAILTFRLHCNLFTIYFFFSGAIPRDCLSQRSNFKSFFNADLRQ